MRKEIAVLLHNIRSAYNVGSIFRTADGAGVQKVVLSGHTPDPIDRFGRERSDIHKAALGAENTVPWEHADDIKIAIRGLQSDGYVVVAVEQDDQATEYRTYARTYERTYGNKPLCFIFGNEVEGIEQEVLDLCDAMIEIPMHGKKESLNVSVSAGIILFAFRL